MQEALPEKLAGMSGPLPKTLPLFMSENCDLSHQLPGGFIAQMVEHCTGIAKVMGQIPLRPEFFLGFNFTIALVVNITAMINHVFYSNNL